MRREDMTPEEKREEYRLHRVAGRASLRIRRDDAGYRLHEAGTGRPIRDGMTLQQLRAELTGADRP